MLFVFAPRPNVIQQIGHGKVGRMAELGVLEGEFSLHCVQTLAPKFLALVDMWDADGIRILLEEAPQNAHIRSIYNDYFRGNPKEMLESAYRKVVAELGSRPEVQIVRKDIAEAADFYPDAHFNVIYLDGTHTHEFVLRDLYKWYPKLRPGGLFICNDFYELPDAALQNMGTISAYQTFSKRFGTHAIALSAWPYSDFYFSNQPHSDLIDGFLGNLWRTNFNMVELPDELIGAYRHRTVPNSGLSTIQLPSFLR